LKPVSSHLAQPLRLVHLQLAVAAEALAPVGQHLASSDGAPSPWKRSACM
jgi:hypothetical protein